MHLMHLARDELYLQEEILAKLYVDMEYLGYVLIFKMLLSMFI